jgi:pyruvate,water dikinase
MSVIVQRMVDARAAGVLFTADPVTTRRNRMVIDAVEGLGDVLVDGRATPDHWLVSRSGDVLEREIRGPLPVLEDDEIEVLIAGAIQAEAKQGIPLDMEWAIDRDHRVQWLQARPITGLPADPNELDSTPRPGAVYTWANIGEMMPGAITPLTYSVTARGIDIGMQRMYRQIGARVPDDCEMRYVAMFFGHLFLNLTTLAELAGEVAGSTKAQMCLALCGRDVDEVAEPAPASKLRRAINGARYVRMLLSAKKHGRALDALEADLSIPDTTIARALYGTIDENLGAVWRAYELHLMSSASSGALAPILLRLVAKNGAPTAEDHAEVARMLAGAEDVESADIAAGAERIVARLARHEETESRFESSDPAQALQWLRSSRSGDAGTEFARYLDRHGHRAVRELELRQKEWAVDPIPVVRSLQSSLRGGQRPRRERPVRQGSTKHPLLARLVSFAHEAVRCRERTKSGLVRVTTIFKHAYRTLGARMAEEGLLPDPDAVFFLTHEELGDLLEGQRAMCDLAVSRRKALDYQMQLRFPELFRGRPEPVKTNPTVTGDEVLMGKPVSRGIVIGRARVVRSLDEAAALEAGEILIAPITDVGWTPYFSLIAGLATDVGSAVSHGAVVAREYGLPAVVNLTNATSRFRTGDEVVLDGDRGTLTRVARASSQGS